MRPDGGEVLLGLKWDVARRSKCKQSDFNRAVADRPLTSASVLGTHFWSRRSTRSLADERSRGNAGKAMPSKKRTRRRGVDPPKNVPGSTRSATPESTDRSVRHSSSGQDY